MDNIYSNKGWEMHEGQLMKRSWLLTIVINGQGIINKTRRVAAKFHLCFFFLLAPDFFLPPHKIYHGVLGIQISLTITLYR